MKERTPNSDGEIKQIHQPEDTYINTLPHEMLAKIGSNLAPIDKFSLSRVCSRFHGLFQPDLDQLALLHLLRAVVDDKKEIVQRLLAAKPELLLTKPRNLIVESQYTWQKFRGEEALKMALKRRQVNMIELLLPYFNRLEDGKEKALRQWDEVETVTNRQVQHLDSLIEPLLALIVKETFPNGSEQDRLIDKISEETKEALLAFRKIILPDDGIVLDNYVDVENLLVAASRAYQTHVNTFQFSDPKQRYLFCISVIGFLQSAQNPELAKAWCGSLISVVHEVRPRGERADSLILVDADTPFYRSSPDSPIGLGFDWLIDLSGKTTGMRPLSHFTTMEFYIEQKQELVTGLKEKLNRGIVADMKARNKQGA